MMGDYSSPMEITVDDFNEFVTLAFGGPCDFNTMMDVPDNTVGWRASTFKYTVDGKNSRNWPGAPEYSEMEQRVLKGEYPRFGTWTILNLLCRLGYIVPGYYQIVQPVKSAEPLLSQ